MDSIKLKAMAKINLGLDVVGKRPNGYHDVRMIMQSVYLYDNLTLTKTKSNKITIRTNLAYLPTNENNLVYKAANLLFQEFKIKGGLAINLDKHIPVAAGLAGGSSDAAATLIGVNKLYNLGLSKKELMKRGVTLGADIPFCIMRGTALSEGIGEILTKVPPMPRCHVIIAKPDVSVSTKYVYDHLRLDETTYHPDIDGLVDKLKEKDLKGITDRLGNTLEQVTEKSHPVIGKIKQFLVEQGALNSLMSGSGPTVYAIFEDKETAKNAQRKLRQAGLAKDVVLTSCYNNRYIKRK